MGTSECFLCGNTQAEVCGKCSTVACCTLHKEHHLVDSPFPSSHFPFPFPFPAPAPAPAPAPSTAAL